VKASDYVPTDGTATTDGAALLARAYCSPRWADDHFCGAGAILGVCTKGAPRWDSRPLLHAILISPARCLWPSTVPEGRHRLIGRVYYFSAWRLEGSRREAPLRHVTHHCGTESVRSLAPDGGGGWSFHALRKAWAQGVLEGVREARVSERSRSGRRRPCGSKVTRSSPVPPPRGRGLPPPGQMLLEAQAGRSSRACTHLLHWGCWSLHACVLLLGAERGAEPS